MDNEKEHSQRATFIESNVLDSGLVRQVEAFAQENEEERRLAFYKSPRIRQFWGEVQEELESWKEIFFDLIFVAVAFQLGKVLEELIEDGGTGDSGLFFTAQFLPLYSQWFMRMVYLARFKPTSYFHGMMDIIYATLIALMALFIAKESEIAASIGGVDDVLKDDENVTFFARLLAEEEKKGIQFNTALAYSVSALLATFINIFQSFEIIFVVRNYGIRDDISEDMKLRERHAAFNSGIFELIRSVGYALCIALSCIGAYVGDERLFIVPLFLGFFTVLGFMFIIFIVRDALNLDRILMVPSNVGFMLKRQGEFTMLMLGEGVLQIIITDVGDDLEGHFKTFIFSFFLLAFIYVLDFNLLPYEPDESALRKSSISAFWIGFIKPFQYSTLIGVGVALKLVLKKQEKLNESEDEREALSLFLLFAIFWILLDRMLNHGYWEITKKDFSNEGKKNKSWSNINFKRIFFSLFWCLTPVSILSLSYIELNGPEFLLVALVLVGAVAFFAIVEYKVFIKGAEEEEVEDEIKMDVDEKKVIVSERIKSSVDGKSSSVRSKKKGGCKLSNTLQYLRKTTRIIDADAKRAWETKDFENFDWHSEVAKLQKLVLMVQETFESSEKAYLEKHAGI